MRKRFTRILAALALLVFMTPTLVGWGQTRTNAYVLDLSNNHEINNNNHSSYTDTWTFQNSSTASDTWSISKGANNNYNNNWTYVRFGGKGGSSSTSTSTITSYVQSTFAFNKDVDKVTVNINSIDANYTPTSIKLQVASNSSFSNQTILDEVTVTSISTPSVAFEPTEDDYWGSDAYYKIIIIGTAKGSSNTGIRISNVEFREYESTDPSITAANVPLTWNATSGSVAYTINNPVEGGAITSATVTSSEPSGWLTINGSNPFSNPIELTCEANTVASEKTATVQLTYTYNTNEIVTKDVTVTQAARPTYTVTYDANGATGGTVPESASYLHGATVTVSENTGNLAKTGYNWNGWNTKADGSGTTFVADESFNITADTTLYAKWTAASYTYTITKTGEDTHATASLKIGDDPAGATIPYNTDVTIVVTPDAGYTYTVAVKDAGDNDVTVTDNHFTMPASAVTVTVNVLKIYNVTTLVAANGSISADPTSGIAGTTITLTATPDAGYMLGAWDVYKTGDAETKVTVTSNQFTMPAYDVTASATFVERAAAFTDGVYSESFSSSLGWWYAVSVSGNATWSQGTPVTNYTGANINGYQQNNEDWLISPKMTAENGKLVFSFSSAARYKDGAALVVLYSTNYNGYGAPSGATWKSLSPTIASAPNSGFSSWTSSGNVVISELSTSTDPLTSSTPIYIAIKYTSTTSAATQFVVKDFTAKQCYPITYYANGGTGTTADANSPYAVDTEVTILDNGFTAPEGKEFTKWNTQSDGNGTDKSPNQKITMTTSGYELYAIWGNACVLKATMSATTGEAVYNYNSGDKRFDINLSSSVHVLGGCDIFDYGFVYSTTVATPTVGADNCTKVQVGDSQPTVDVAFEETLENVTNGATYYVRSYATNAAGTAYSDVISIAVPANFPTWTISYTTNGEDESTTTSIFKGAPISGLLAAPEQDVPSGYTFMGWYGSDYALSNEAPTFVKNGDAINSNLTLKAVFAISTVTGEGTAELTNTTIKDNRTGKTSYGDYSIGDWSGKFMIAKNGEVYGLQLGYNTNSSASAYNSHLTTPECDYNITSITINTNNSTASGRKFFLCNASNLGTASSTNATYGYGSTSSANGSVTINVNGNTKQFHIYPDGTAYIASVSFAYRNVSYSSYCTSVSPQTAISGTISEGHLTTDGTIASDAAVYITTPLTINNGVTLTVNGALGNDNPANLIIEDGGQLITSNKVNATLKKTVDSYTVATGTNENPTDGWYFIASPVDNYATSNLALSTADLYAYDEETNYWWNAKNEAVGNHAFTTLKRGQGYLYANSDDQTLPFAGEMEASDTEISVDLSYAGSGSSKGVNLLGNPFTRNLTGDDIELDGTNITSYYAVENGTEITSRAIADYPIKPGRGFIVQATDDDQTLVFNPSSKGKRNETKVKPSFIRIEAGNEDFMDRAYVQLGKGNTLRKMTINDNVAHVYVMKDGKDYAAATIAEAQGEMPVNFRAYVAGEYTITVNPENVEMGYLHLIDNIAGTDIDLLANPSYSFNAKGDDYESRFRLVFSANMTNAEMGEDFAFFSNGQLVIANVGEAILQVIDVTGRVVANENINGTCSKAISAKAGVYVLRLINGTDVKTQKIVIR